MSEEILSVKVDEVQLHPDNARRGDVAAIMRSLERFGQVKPIIVQRSTGYVVAGNHTLQAAKELGWSTIKAMILDMDDEKAKAYLIADNATSDRATYDKGKLYDILAKGLGDLSGTGFSDGDVELLRDELTRKEPEKKELPQIEVEVKEDPFDPEQPDERPEKEEANREVVIRLTPTQLAELTEQARALQHVWESRTLVDIIVRSVKESHDRWQASVGAPKRGSSELGVPEEMVGVQF